MGYDSLAQLGTQRIPRPFEVGLEISFVMCDILMLQVEGLITGLHDEPTWMLWHSDESVEFISLHTSTAPQRKLNMPFAAEAALTICGKLCALA